MPTGSNETQRLVIAGINVKNTGVTALFTPAQQQFFVSKINCVIAAASGLVVGPTLSIGTTGGSNIDICASVATGLTGLNTCIDMAMIAGRPVIQTGTAINLNISVAATGTSGSLTMILEGFYM